jgi:hypothetical protein
MFQQHVGLVAVTLFYVSATRGPCCCDSVLCFSNTWALLLWLCSMFQQHVSLVAVTLFYVSATRGPCCCNSVLCFSNTWTLLLQLCSMLQQHVSLVAVTLFYVSATRGPCAVTLFYVSACKRKEDPQSQPEHTPAPKKPRLVFTDLQRRTLQAIFKVAHSVTPFVFLSRPSPSFAARL